MVVYLNDIWSLYFHDPYDMNWDGNSYKFISTISSVEDFINIYNVFKDLWTRGMFFIMREHIIPRWEDENNRNGGCFSFKILKEDFDLKWFDICALILGETFGKTDNVSENINGLSISPKKNYYIIRIWIKNNNIANKELYNFNIPSYSTLMFKTYSEML
jgi:translation initiation factor 4E